MIGLGAWVLCRWNVLAPTPTLTACSLGWRTETELRSLQRDSVRGGRSPRWRCCWRGYFWRGDWVWSKIAMIATVCTYGTSSKDTMAPLGGGRFLASRLGSEQGCQGCQPLCLRDQWDGWPDGAGRFVPPGGIDETHPSIARA